MSSKPVWGQCDKRMLVGAVCYRQLCGCTVPGIRLFCDRLFFDPLVVGILKIDLVDTVGTKDNFAECAVET